MPQKLIVTTIGKSVRKIAQIRGGSGSALPGLVVEKIDANFISDTLSHLPRGIVVVSGTNGKTTTTKMVVELLESQGLRVFTNRTGSNFTRGVAAALLGEIDARGRLHADIAVLELDEAHAVHFVRKISPTYSLLLNVMRDQLDRFGEIDTTARMLQTIAEATTECVVLNRDDPRLSRDSFRKNIGAQIHTYGASGDVLKDFPSDDDMHTAGNAPRQPAHAEPHDDDVELRAFSGQHAEIYFDSATHEVDLQLSGIYNIINAVGAIAMTRAIMGEDLDTDSMLTALSNVKPAFGRGETLIVDGQPLQLVLVKNPAGFRLALKSFDPEGYATMIAINDNYADGRDMSWLWDVDFESLGGGVAVVSGVRASDMALRLKYDMITVDKITESLEDGLAALLEANASKPKRIYCTYTAMLHLRKLLKQHTEVEDIS